MQGQYQETVAGAMYGLKIGEDHDHPEYTVHAGGFLRWNDAFIPTIKLDYTPFSVCLSYDVNVSSFSPATGGAGAYEISLIYFGRINKHERNPSYNWSCPKLY